MFTMRIYRCGSTAIVLEQVSHWTVEQDETGGPEFVVSMQNGHRVRLGRDDTPDGTDGFAIEQDFMAFIEKVARL